MPNEIYLQTRRKLATMISGRAARGVLDRSLKAAGYSREQVTAGQMRETLLGPVLRELATILPRAGLKHNLSQLGASLVDPPTAEAAPPPPASEPIPAKQLIGTGSGDGKQTLSSFPVVEISDEPEAEEPEDVAVAEANQQPAAAPGAADAEPAPTGGTPKEAGTGEHAAAAAAAAKEKEAVAAVAATATLEEPTADELAAPTRGLPAQRLRELVLHFAQLDHVRQVAAMRASGEMVEVRGSAVDVAGLSGLASSSIGLFERHGRLRSYYLKHPQGQLFLFPVKGDIIAVVGNSELNLGAVFTALTALEEEL